jgi:hypothetical protein
MSHYVSFYCKTHDEQDWASANHGADALLEMASILPFLQKLQEVNSQLKHCDLEVHFVTPYEGDAARTFLLEHPPGPDHELVIRSEYWSPEHADRYADIPVPAS